MVYSSRMMLSRIMFVLSTYNTETFNVMPYFRSKPSGLLIIVNLDSRNKSIHSIN